MRKMKKTKNLFTSIGIFLIVFQMVVEIIPWISEGRLPIPDTTNIYEPIELVGFTITLVASKIILVIGIILCAIGIKKDKSKK